MIPAKGAKGSVGEGEVCKKAQVTHHAGGQSVSEKSQVTQTSKNVFEKSNSKTQYFVRAVKGRRMTKNGVEFLIGWCDFPLEKDDTWESIINLPGSEHMIAEFQKLGKQSTKLTLQLQSVIDKRNTRNEKNAQTQRDRTETDSQFLLHNRISEEDGVQGGRYNVTHIYDMTHV